MPLSKTLPPSYLVLSFLIHTLLLSGCATLKSNTFIGSAIGASTGALGGAAIGAPQHTGSGAMVGAASGAVLGALIGLLTEPKTNKAPSKLNMDGMALDDPTFTSPEVRRVWIPDKIDGNKFIKGHYMFVLERGVVWRMP